MNELLILRLAGPQDKDDKELLNWRGASGANMGADTWS